MIRPVPKKRKQRRKPRQANNKTVMGDRGIGEGGKTIREKRVEEERMHKQTWRERILQSMERDPRAARMRRIQCSSEEREGQKSNPTKVWTPACPDL